MQNNPLLNQTISHRTSSHSIIPKSPLSKIQPMPITRINLTNSPGTRTKFKLYGYKNFSKLSAAGPYTLQTLQNIIRTPHLRIIQNFEFDPYLCDDSYLTELKLALKKLKTVKKINLVIRRLSNNSPRETERLKAIGSNLSKLLRIRKIRVEFPKTSNLEECHILTLFSSLQKSYLLKSLEWIIVESPLLSAKYYRVFNFLMKKLRKLEHSKEYISLKEGIPNSDVNDPEILSEVPKLSQIKYVEIMYSVSKEWSQIGDNGDLGNQIINQYLIGHTALEGHKLKVIK